MSKRNNGSQNKQLIILDTNVLLSDPKAMLHFENNDVIIPFGVLGEIDSFKKQFSDLGVNARSVCRCLDEL